MLCGASEESSVILFTTLSSVTCSKYISEFDFQFQFVICCVYFYFISCTVLRLVKKKYSNRKKLEFEIFISISFLGSPELQKVFHKMYFHMYFCRKR